MFSAIREFVTTPRARPNTRKGTKATQPSAAIIDVDQPTEAEQNEILRHIPDWEDFVVEGENGDLEVQGRVLKATKVNNEENGKIEDRKGDDGKGRYRREPQHIEPSDVRAPRTEHPPLSHDHCDARQKEDAERIRMLDKDMERLGKELQMAKKELSESKQQLIISNSRVYALESTNNQLLHELKFVTNREVRTQQLANHHISEIENASSKKDKENGVLRDKLRVTEVKIDEMAQLLQERTADFKGTQAFITAADLYSGADIIKMVEALDAENFQIAAFVAELIEDETMVASDEERTQNVVKSEDILKWVARYVGTELFTYLGKDPSLIRADPLPLQLALQGFLAMWCTHRIRVFLDGSLGSDLHGLYQRIKCCEVQAVSGRWRAITSAQLQGWRNENDTDIQYALDTIKGLLYLCGWSSSDTTRSDKSLATIQDMFYNMVKQQVRLKKAIKEEITTVDLEVFIHGPGDLFDNTMDDIYKDGASKSVKHSERRSNVLCTVGMGLRKSVTNRGELLKSHADLLLKPKVVLESALHDINDALDHDKDVRQAVRDTDIVSNDEEA